MNITHLDSPDGKIEFFVFRPGRGLMWLFRFLLWARIWRPSLVKHRRLVEQGKTGFWIHK